MRSQRSARRHRWVRNRSNWGIGGRSMTAALVENKNENTAMTKALAAKKAAEKRPFYRKLYVQVLIAVALGAALGHYYPTFSVQLKPYGDAFIRAIKVVVAPIIFTTIVVGIAKMGDIRKVANVGLKALTDFFMSTIPKSVLDPLVHVDILPVLLIAILLGVALSFAGERGKPIVSFLDSASVALFGMVRIIMYFAPIAAGCAMAFTIGKYGSKTLVDLGELVLSIYIVSILFVAIVLGGFLRICGINILRVLSY